MSNVKLMHTPTQVKLSNLNLSIDERHSKKMRSMKVENKQRINLSM